RSLGETFGDVACLGGVEKTDLIKVPIEKSPSHNESESNYKQPAVAVVVESKQELDSVEQQT
ncbi:unnamed protein product, partial [Rotaria socialis]